MAEMRDAKKGGGPLGRGRGHHLPLGLVLAMALPILALTPVLAQAPAPAPAEAPAAAPAPVVEADPEQAAAAWKQYQLDNATVCVGDPARVMRTAAEWTVGKMRYRVRGGQASLRWIDGSPHPRQIRLGVLSGIKEPDAETLVALKGFLDAFSKAQVDAVLVGGDSGFSGLELDKVFGALGESGLPILVIAGNNESRSKLNRSLRGLSATQPNLLNLDLVRLVQAEGFGVVSLPGYHLKAFASSGASCLHDDDDVRALEGIFADVKGERILLAHGPPLQKGKAGVDWVDAETGNVGNALLARVLRKVQARLTVAGHILESGSRATDAKGKAVAPGKMRASLVLNPGQVSTLPYLLSLGWLSHGTAALVTLEGGKVSWRRLKAPKP